MYISFLAEPRRGNGDNDKKVSNAAVTVRYRTVHVRGTSSTCIGIAHWKRGIFLNKNVCKMQKLSNEHRILTLL